MLIISSHRCHLYRRKLEVTQHQLADQHAYTIKLKNKGTDPDLVEQEMLVEKQLQKRAVSIANKVFLWIYCPCLQLHILDILQIIFHVAYCMTGVISSLTLGGELSKAQSQHS